MKRILICALLLTTALACHEDQPSYSSNSSATSNNSSDAENSNGTTNTTNSNGTTGGATNNGTTDGTTNGTGTTCAAEGEPCTDQACCAELTCDGESSLCAAADDDDDGCPEDFSTAEGLACSTEGTSCGDCSDPCGFCNLLQCEGGSWTRLEVFPDPTCGCAERGEACTDEPCCEGERLVCDGETSTCVEPREIVCNEVDEAFFPSFDTSCETSDDCAVAEHMINCCGTLLAIGINVNALPDFDAAEETCRNQYPGCGCASEPMEADDGTRFDGTRPAQAICFNNTCTSTFALGFREICTRDDECFGDLGCCPPCGLPDCGGNVCMGLCDPEDENCGGGCPAFP